MLKSQVFAHLCPIVRLPSLISRSKDIPITSEDIRLREMFGIKPGENFSLDENVKDLLDLINVGSQKRPESVE